MQCKANGGSTERTEPQVGVLLGQRFSTGGSRSCVDWVATIIYESMEELLDIYFAAHMTQCNNFNHLFPLTYYQVVLVFTFVG